MEQPGGVIDGDRLAILQRACRWPERPEILAGLVEEFVSSAATRVETLGVAVSGDERDVDQVLLLAHGLKGSAVNFGADRLAAVAAELEQRIRQGVVPPGEAAEMIGRLGAALDEASVALRRASAGRSPDCSPIPGLQPASTSGGGSRPASCGGSGSPWTTPSRRVVRVRAT